jgi:hypothetical protein
MNTIRRMMPAFLAVILAAGLAACGSSAKPHVSKPTDPLAKLTAIQILSKAMTDTVNAPEVQFATGGTLSGGQLVSSVLTIVRGKGCKGTVNEGEQGSVDLVSLGRTVWLKPDDIFWQNVIDSKPSDTALATAVNTLEGKYLEESTNGKSGLVQLASLCTALNRLKVTSTIGKTGKLTKQGLSPLDGKQVMTIMDVSKAGTAYFWTTDTSSPLLLTAQLPDPSLDYMGFSDYGQHITITPPPASQVVDGSTSGF